MRERTALTSIAVLVGLSLVPAVLLYWLFGELSSANVEWAASEEVRLGGPIAAFAAILVLLATLYSKFRAAGATEMDIARPFVGRWQLKSESNTSDRVATSHVTAEVTTTGRLLLSGNLLDNHGKEIGEWASKEVFCTPSSLAYRYVITDKVSGQTAIGFSRVTIKQYDRRKRPVLMSGIWDVIGPDHHDGTVELKRINE